MSAQVIRRRQDSFTGESTPLPLPSRRFPSHQNRNHFSKVRDRNPELANNHCLRKKSSSNLRAVADLFESASEQRMPVIFQIDVQQIARVPDELRVFRLQFQLQLPCIELQLAEISGLFDVINSAKHQLWKGLEYQSNPRALDINSTPAYIVGRDGTPAYSRTFCRAA